MTAKRLPKGTLKEASSFRYADVAPAIPLPAHSPQVYTYSIPAAVALPLFCRVSIPFGKRTVIGVVVNLHNNKVPYPTKALAVHSLVQLTVHQVAFAKWISQTMQGGLGYTLRLFFPSGRAQAVVHAAEVILATQQSHAARAYIEENLEKRLDYLKALTQNEALHQQVLILVPEKWMIERLLSVAADDGSPWLGIHAELTPKQFATAWQSVLHGQARIIVGTQKALFLPFQSLGTIVVEEEFYPTHKLWDQYPRLHTIYAAKQLAQIYHSRLTYTTSFASLALRKAIQDEGVEVEQEHGLVVRPTIIAPSAEDLHKHHLLPDAFVMALKRWVQAKEHIVILHNARGSWQTVVCRQCRTAMRCPRCGVAMVLHKTTLQCHHCATTLPLPKECPTCHKGKLTMIGAGSEKITDVIAALLPKKVPVTRIDAHTDLPPLTPRFKKKGGAHVFIGTTALLRQIPAASIDRAVYLFPERGLLYPDFRSEERTYLLLVRLQQLLANKKRRVILVTRRKGLIEERLSVSPGTFLQLQLRDRKRLRYPPFTDAVLLTFRAKDTKTVVHKATRARERLDELADNGITIRGPFSSFLKSKRGKMEMHILLLGRLEELTRLTSQVSADTVDVAPERIL